MADATRSTLGDHPYRRFNLEELGLLPEDWREQVLAIAGSHSLFVHLDGKSPTSLEPADSEGSDYYVVSGDLVAMHLGWLYNLYCSDLMEIVASVSGRAMCVSSDIQYGINVNILKGCGARYEWHIDSNPFTGILFVTSHIASEGGALVIRPWSHGEGLVIEPRAAEFVVFQAGSVPHSVAPLKEDVARISIPMSYFFQGQEAVVSGDLTSYLFKSK